MQFKRERKELRDGRTNVVVEIPTEKENTEGGHALFSAVPPDQMVDYRDGGKLIIEVPGPSSLNTPELNKLAKRAWQMEVGLKGATKPVDAGLFIAALRAIEDMAYAVTSATKPKVALLA